MTVMNPQPLHLIAFAALQAFMGLAQATDAKPELKLPGVTVTGEGGKTQRPMGSVSVLDETQLEESRVFTLNEALRKLPGLNVRDEEGFGLRPNIGLRGLNPTRSTKITLLEDGVPLAYAPYGDNASYYFPPVDRFVSVELLKGADVLAYGPQTIGGVINFRTPMPTREFSGFVQGVIGSRDFSDAKLQLSSDGYLLDLTRKQGKGARDHTESTLTDFNLKAYFEPAPGHQLVAKLSHFIEDSLVTYSGLTQAELDNFGPDYNPFRNDRFDTRRTGGSLTHRWAIGGGKRLTTQLYSAYFARDWWRQSSSSTDTQCGTAFRDARLAGDRVDVDACNSSQGRLRAYTTTGLDSRLSLGHDWLGTSSTLDLGVKLHDEKQDRKQVNASSSTGRAGTLAEDNRRDTRAYSAFIANRAEIGEHGLVSASLRYESIDNQRQNRLNPAQPGSKALNAWIPGLAAGWKLDDRWSVFGGVHRGFAPPRTEDIIAGNGTSTEVEAERSLNWEAGLRHQGHGGFSASATAFRNDYSRLIAVGSIAGGNTPLAQGQALFQGLELAASYYPTQGLFANAAFTWLPTARQVRPFTQVVGGAVIAGSSAGKRQPYAPKLNATLSVGYGAEAWNAQLEWVRVGEQFADFANTESPSANGQLGRIATANTWNLAANWRLDRDWLLFATVKNLADTRAIVDRTRGIQVQAPRLVQLGIRHRL
jgi:Fe(3+) dicitrate transport protein